MKPSLKFIADTDEHHFFVMKVVNEKRSLRGSKASTGSKPMLHFWRSKDSAERKEKTFLPVYRDAADREDWRLGIRKDDPDFSAWVIMDGPREALDLPFDLTEGHRIPLRIWDEIEDQDIPIRLIGGPQPTKWVRAKRRKKEMSWSL